MHKTPEWIQLFHISAMEVYRWIKSGQQRWSVKRLDIRCSMGHSIGGDYFSFSAMFGWWGDRLCVARNTLCNMWQPLRGKNFGVQSIKQRYFWLTMHQDAREITRNCRSCQSFLNVPTQPLEKLTVMSSLWPLAQWGIDMIGLLPKGWGTATHAIVTIYYFTKWVKVEALS